ncbi:MAG: alpha/beta hydrolase [Pseudomonadota bacterium]
MISLRHALAGVLALTLACSGAAFAQNAAPQLDPPADTPIGSGPHKAVMEMEPALPGFTFYRPADLAELPDRSLPIVLWGNGACANTGNAFRAFLSEIASYGYLVIALGPIDPGATIFETQHLPHAGAAPPIVLPPNMPPPATRTAQLIQALDWATGSAAQSTRYRGKLNTTAVAVMGMSCGGAQTIEAAADPRFKTAVVWNAGLFPGGTSMAGGRNLTKDDLNRLHAPTAYISGDESDIAFINANDDYARLAQMGLPVFRGWERGVGHGGNYGLPSGGEFAGIGVAWLNWQLKGDQRAGLMFRGADCGLCVNPRWVVQSSHLN